MSRSIIIIITIVINSDLVLGQKVSKHYTGCVWELMTCSLYKCLMVSIEMLCLDCTFRVKDEDDSMSISSDCRPTLLVLVITAGVPQLNLHLQCGKKGNK